jgi:hypothetical protein
MARLPGSFSIDISAANNQQTAQLGAAYLSSKVKSSVSTAKT